MARRSSGMSECYKPKTADVPSAVRTIRLYAGPTTTMSELKSRCRSKEYDRRHNRRQHLRRKFRLQESDYDRMLVEQDGCCAICKSRNPGTNHCTSR